MKNFAKYIIQGTGMAIGVIIIVVVVIAGIKIKNNITNKRLEKQIEKTVATEEQKKIDREKLSKLGLTDEEIENALTNGVDINEDGEYTIKVISGVGDVRIYDMISLKKVKTLDTVNSKKISMFQGELGYKIVPDNGLIIECVKK